MDNNIWRVFEVLNYTKIEEQNNGKDPYPLAFLLRNQ